MAPAGYCGQWAVEHLASTFAKPQGPPRPRVPKTALRGFQSLASSPLIVIAPASQLTKSDGMRSPVSGEPSEPTCKHSTTEFSARCLKSNARHFPNSVFMMLLCELQVPLELFTLT